MSEHIIKFFPKMPANKTDRDIVENKENITINYTLYDADNDPWDLGFTSSFLFTLTNDSIKNVSLHEKVNSKEDMFDLLSEFYKSRNVKVKDKKILCIDVIFVQMMYRGQGIGKLMVNDLIDNMKREGIEYIILKAHPFIVWKFGLVNTKSNKKMKEEKDILQKFYQGLGFEFLKKNSDSMYIKLV